MLTGRLAKWAVILQQYDIQYVPQKAIKGHALVDFLAAHLMPDDSPINRDLPDEEVFAVDTYPEWQMYFDRLSYFFKFFQSVRLDFLKNSQNTPK